MQINSGLFSLALAGFAALATAQPHGHHHRRNLKLRDVVTEHVTTTVHQYAQAAATPSATASPKESPAVEVAAVDDFSFAASSSASAPTVSVSDTPSYAGTSKKQVSSGSSAGVGTAFEDGTLDCSTFPSQYGAVKTSWVNPQGWSGVQYKEGTGKWATGSECVEGAYCSYACPTGYSKAQWPAEQPADGQSIGGLLCKNGKLYRTRTEASTLCEQGETGTQVENKLGQSVAICRTDYPGTENMVIPTVIGAGSSGPMTVPDANESYEWQGKKTSAQFYVNNAGVSQDQGCVWGTESGTTGNWAPLVFGTGKDASGNTFISVSRNHLSSKGANFSVKLLTGDSTESDFEGSLATNGVANPGCTVSGNAGVTYVLY
ncbi:hypothetical protein EDC01DRAFT_745854 [Geopyxis carbonaria]|nr:hypothetical protein EDC01DRAFT_745854 [Geopyxis carbonaria]